MRLARAELVVSRGEMGTMTVRQGLGEDDKGEEKGGSGESGEHRNEREGVQRAPKKGGWKVRYSRGEG